MARKKRSNALQWVVEELAESDSYFQKAMFGCEAIYLHGRMMVVLADRGKPDWQGVLLPTAREQHAAIIADFPALAPHGVLGKWLYLPERHDEFEEIIPEVMACIAEGDSRFGVEPGAPRKRKKVKKAR